MIPYNKTEVNTLDQSTDWSLYYFKRNTDPIHILAIFCVYNKEEIVACMV